MSFWKTLSFLTALVAVCFFPAPALHSDSPGQTSNLQIKTKGNAAKYLQEIEVFNADGAAFDFENTLDFPVDDLIRINLGLGESMSKVITLKRHPGITAEFRVEQQYETSVTIMDEGPHMDLLDWKDHVSEWEPLETRARDSFVSTEVRSEEFPKVSRTELMAAVDAESKRRAGKGHDQGDRWVQLANRCENVTNDPCGVSVSKVRLRLRVKENGAWRDIQTIELKVPMGC
jgi:hypothetical protein